jgi:hypothetical protein
MDNTTKKQYADDPEGYWQLKKDKEEQATQDFNSWWERTHPNEVPGGNTVSYLPKE